MSKVTSKPYLTPVSIRNSAGDVVGIDTDALKISGAVTFASGAEVSLASGTSVDVGNFPATQAVSASSLPLPTGASVSSKQPSLGTAGSASTDVISVQGVASMTALIVDGSATTQPISASALPLPAGASSEATLLLAEAHLGTIDTSTASVATTVYADGDAVGASDDGLLVMGKDNSNNAHPIRITSNGDVEVEIADFVKSQATMANSFPVVVASDQSTLAVEEQYTWTTFTMFDAVTTADGDAVTSATLDLGSDSATPGAGMALVFFLDLSAAVTGWELKIQTSPDGVTFYNDSLDNNKLEGTITSGALTLDNEFGGIFSGSRYWRFVFTNNDGGATSTDITLKAGYYA